MKIGQKPELPSVLAQAGFAKQIKSTTGAIEGASKDVAAAVAAGAPVTVSTAARSLGQTSRAAGSFDASKVQAMRAAIEKGEFSVSAGVVAEKMLSNAREVLSRARG